MLPVGLSACAMSSSVPTAVTPQTVRTALSHNYSYTSLYSFTGGSSGVRAFYTLTELNGALYGASPAGNYCGVAFRMTTSGVYTPIYEFKCDADGSYPESSLVAYNGVLYGTTLEGGKYGGGTVFALTTSGSKHVIYNFKIYYDGNGPSGNLVVADGKLYGTTETYQRRTGGEYSLGSVFSVTLSGKERILHIFGGAPGDGASPTGLVVVHGKLYGATSAGGADDDGTVFGMSTTHDDERVLHSFTGTPKDGEDPIAPPTWWNGTLYGTTSSGGSDSSPNGTVYEVSLTGKEKIIHDFGDLDGENPGAALIVSGDAAYGTTEGGGSAGDGTIFRISPKGHEKVVYSFGTTPYDGELPTAALTAIGKTFYGTTTYGGFFGFGNFFRLTP